MFIYSNAVVKTLAQGTLYHLHCSMHFPVPLGVEKVGCKYVAYRVLTFEHTVSLAFESITLRQIYLETPYNLISISTDSHCGQPNPEHGDLTLLQP